MWIEVIQETKLSAELEGIFGIVPGLNPISGALNSRGRKDKKAVGL